MIDLFAVFTRGGILLWRHELVPLGEAPLNALVTRVLLEEKKAQESFRLGNHSMRWLLDNKRGLVFVACYLTRSSLDYVPDLLAAARKAFVAQFEGRLAALPAPEDVDFEKAYLRIVDRMETRAIGPVKVVKKASRVTVSPGEEAGENRKGNSSSGGDASGYEADVSNADDEGPATGTGTGGADESGRAAAVPSPSSPASQTPSPEGGAGDAAAEEGGEQEEEVSTLLVSRRRQRKPRQFAESRKAANLEKTRADGTAKAGLTVTTPADDDDDDSGGNDAGDDGDDDGSSASSSKPRGSPLSRLAGRRRNAGPRPFQKKAKKPSASPTKGVASKKPKKPQRYDQFGDAPAVLDHSRDSAEDLLNSVETVNSAELYASDSEVSGSDYDDDDDDDDDEGAGGSGGGGLFGFFSKLTGQVLDEEALRPVLDQMRLQLTERNVAADIAEKLVASLGASLVGKTAGTFSTIKGMVRKATEEALARILTPKRSVDVLQGILRARAEGRPYVIVVLGVNGVGKSTSLAKLTSYLLSKDFKVSIAACDTFRSGAVEQLRTHGRALGVDVFEQGYQKDSSAVAQAGIRAAKKRGDDVVLVDTAGRMTNAEPLMRSIAKLVTTNKPDLVLFVGEAVCGGDAVEQLTGFNRALVDYSPDANPTTVGGIVLSKYDTVDDNVGTAISLTYTSGVPILFVGTGQSYGDLKRCNSKLLIKQLLR